ncbi:glycosyltransferase family 2 protein [Desulfobacula sp.]|uniref:glycosyltransferase family 2 protein n=1 Tax=Desulfobacula sp. TaxID=2593537 RepID=UPI001EC14BBE|nr:glycosyltransferase [Desulfobacula sp.]
MKVSKTQRYASKCINPKSILNDVPDIIAPRVSVVIIGFNGLAHIDLCLSSTLDQSLPSDDYEVILLDNASNDGMPEYVEKNYPQVRVIRFQQNYGFNEACNRSLSLINGDFIVFLPQDTIVHRKWLFSLIHLAESDQNIKVCWTNTINPWAHEFDARDRVKLAKHIYYPEITILGFTQCKVLPYKANPLFSLGVAGTSFGIKRDFLGELGPMLDGNFFHYCGDTDLGLRVNLLGYRVVMSPEAIVYHIDTDKSFINLSLFIKYFFGTVDRILLYYKCMSWAEFILFSPFLIVGIAAKVFSIRLPSPIQWGLFCLVLPFSPLIFFVSLFFAGKVNKERTIIKQSRKRNKFWLLRKIFSINQ